MTKEITEKLMTVYDVAEWIQVQPQTIRKWVREGKLSCLRLSNNVVRFEKQQVLRTIRKLSNTKRRS